MGQVFATELRLGRKVALKLPPDDVTREPFASSGSNGRPGPTPQLTTARQDRGDHDREHTQAVGRLTTVVVLRSNASAS